MGVIRVTIILTLMEPMMPIISTIFKMWNSFSSTTTPKFTPPRLATLLPPWEYYPKSPHPTWFHHRKVIYSIKVFSIKTKICIPTIQSINMSKLIPRCTPYELGYYWNVWGFEIVISPPLIQFVLNLSQYHNLY
jgi:hypothetical protein